MSPHCHNCQHSVRGHYYERLRYRSECGFDPANIKPTPPGGICDEYKFGDNPIREEDGGWYFWDEAWANRYGPYNSMKECSEHFQKYCEHLEGGTP